MASLPRKRDDDQVRYTIAQLTEMRRKILRFARSLPPGPERNGHRDIAAKLRALFRNKLWLAAHTVAGSTEYQVYTMATDGSALTETDLDRPNDRAAVRAAKQFVDGHDIELWQGDRKGHRTRAQGLARRRHHAAKRIFSHSKLCNGYGNHLHERGGGLMEKPATDLFDPQAFLAKVGNGKTIQECRKNEVVFKQGEIADTIFYIQKGKFKVVVLSEQGKEAVVGILEPGQFFGEGCLNGHPLRMATTSAIEDSVLTKITKTAMLAALHDEPKFSELFLAYLLARNSRIEEDLVDQLFNSSEKRLARLLLLLAHFGKEDVKPIDIDISQETLAEMIGTTRSRVSYFMNKFRNLGLISYNGKIEVHNSLLNAVLHEKPHINRDEKAGGDETAS